MFEKIRLTKIVTIDSSHYLNQSKWSKEKNKKVFGRCSGYKGSSDKSIPHGHQWKIEITVEGYRNSQSGFVINFKDLKSLIEKEIVGKLDHTCLNLVIPEEYHPVTVENLSLWIVNETKLKETLHKKNVVLYSVKIWETPDSFVELVCEQ